VAFAAVAERRQVGFTYRGRQRVVDPWRLSFHRGHWYLSGLDRTRGGGGEERMFRLDRLESPLAAHGPAAAFARPSVTQAAPPPAWRLGDEDEVLAELFVDAEQARWARQALGEGAVRSIGSDGSVVFEVGVTNRDAFRSFVLGFLDHAEVLGPPELRTDLVTWLQAQTGVTPGGDGE
jgi:predicted DNA-binding transcriptional regulator YafY